MPLCSRLCRQHLSERLSVRLYTHKAFAGRHLPRYHRFSTEHTRSLGPQTGRVSAEYCERPVKYGEQHCREIGSHKRYDDKCKNESIWLDDGTHIFHINLEDKKQKSRGSWKAPEWNKDTKAFDFSKGCEIVLEPANGVFKDGKKTVVEYIKVE